MEEYAEKLFRQRGPVGGAEITDIHAQLLEADEALAEEQEEFADEGLDTDYADVYD
jgi:hypothetical protein